MNRTSSVEVKFFEVSMVSLRVHYRKSLVNTSLLLIWLPLMTIKHFRWSVQTSWNARFPSKIIVLTSIKNIYPSEFGDKRNLTYFCISFFFPPLWYDWIELIRLKLVNLTQIFNHTYTTNNGLNNNNHYNNIYYNNNNYYNV